MARRGNASPDRARLVVTDGRYEAEANRYFQGRIRLLFLIAGAAACGFYAARLLEAAGRDTVDAAFFTRPFAIVHALCCGLAILVFVALSRRAFRRPVLEGLDALGLYLGAGTCLAFYARRYSEGPEIVVGILAVWIIAHAVVVPGTARRTILLSVPLPLTVLGIDLAQGPPHYNNGQPMVESSTIMESILWKQALLLFGVAVAGMSSRINAALLEKLRAARRIGHYHLEEKIGEGAHGAVYRATHALLRRKTALKLLRPEVMGEETIRRFEREVRLASRLTHPNTIRIYDFGRSGSGAFYYTMQYLVGLDLAAVVRLGGPLPASRTIAILDQVCRSLAEAHGMGLVHRDLKPENVMLCVLGGEYDVVKVLDFGLAKEQGNSGKTLTRTGDVCGSPLTMAPEILRGFSPTPACDLYAVGVVGCYLLTGKPIFDATTTAEFLAHHLEHPPIPPSRRGARVDPALEAVLLQCLEKDPQRRPSGAAALRRSLMACTGAGTWTQEEAAAWWARSGADRRIA